MKSIFIKIKLVFLVLVILFASNSYAITSHFCGQQLVAVSYFGDDLNCGMETTGDDCDAPKVKKNCCTDVLTFVESQDFNATVKLEMDQLQMVFVASFVVSYINLFQECSSQEKERFKDFPPPDIYEDIQVLHQTFLI